MLNKQEIIDYIKNNLLINDTLNSAKVRWLDEKSIEYISIMNRTCYLDISCKFTERLFHILHNIEDIPKCKCGKLLKFKSINVGYIKTCSSHTCMRDGKEWNSCSETKKIENLKQLETFKEYVRQKINYNDELDIIVYIKKVLKTTENGKKSKLLSNIDYRINKRELSLILFLTKDLIPYTLDDIVKFSDFNFSERFYILYNRIKEIPKCSCYKNKKYISFINGYANACSNKCRIIDNTNFIFESIKEQGFKILNTEEIYNIKDKEITVQCLKCGKISEREMFNARWKHVYCSGCYGDIGISREETEVYEYIQTLSNNIQQSYYINSSKKEIDIFDSSINLGIEYNGVYWHSTNDLSDLKEFKIKHLQKTEECIQNNIKLFHIFSNEWCNKITQDIWKSMLNNAYKLNKTIFARKCFLKPITKKECDLFLNENHLQGEDKSSIRYGLLYENNIVAVMTFCKSRFDKNYDYELSRYCNKKYVNVVGGAGKLLKHFIQKDKPKNIVTYANRRYSEGKLYETLNFKKIGNTSPNYFYFKSGNILYSRNSFQKHLLKNKLDLYDENKTEFENMFINGYKVIFDCGNIKYDLKLT